MNAGQNEEQQGTGEQTAEEQNPEMTGKEVQPERTEPQSGAPQQERTQAEQSQSELAQQQPERAEPQSGTPQQQPEQSQPEQSQSELVQQPEQEQSQSQQQQRQAGQQPNRQRQQKKAHGGTGASVCYGVWMNLGLPLNLIGLYLVIMITLITGQNGNQLKKFEALMAVYGVCLLVYGCIAFGFGIRCIIRSFRQYHAGDEIACLNNMLVIKYSLVVFYVLNVGGAVALFGAIGVIALLLSRGLAILMLPVLFPGIAVAVLAGMFLCFMVMLPGSIYAIQVIRFSVREGKLSPLAGIVHTILQLIFIVDVLDTMYLSVCKWQRGKKSAVLIGCVYLIAIFKIAQFILGLS